MRYVTSWRIPRSADTVGREAPRTASHAVAGSFLALLARVVAPQIRLAYQADLRLQLRHISRLIFVVEFRGGIGKRNRAEFIHHFLRELGNVKGLLPGVDARITLAQDRQGLPDNNYELFLHLESLFAALGEWTEYLKAQCKPAVQ